jgi:hypothetical protein
MIGAVGKERSWPRKGTRQILEAQPEKFAIVCYGILDSSATGPSTPYAFLSLLFPTAPRMLVALLRRYIIACPFGS